MANWGANFVVAVSFLTLLNAISNAGTFFLMGSLSLVAVATSGGRSTRPKA